MLKLSFLVSVFGTLSRRLCAVQHWVPSTEFGVQSREYRVGVLSLSNEYWVLSSENVNPTFPI